MHLEFYNGILYKVEYQPNLSTNYYGRRKAYFIETEEENWSKARIAIASIMEDILGYKQGSIVSKGQHQMKYQVNPTMQNAFAPYYEFSFDEHINKYVYTFIEPYDD